MLNLRLREFIKGNILKKERKMFLNNFKKTSCGSKRNLQWSNKTKSFC